MVRDILLLGIGGLFGLGVALVSLAIPYYLPNLPPWVAHSMLWGGLALMVVMAIDAVFLYSWWDKPGSKMGPALFINLGFCLVVFGFVWRYSPVEPAALPPVGPPIQDVSILADCTSTILPTYAPASGVIMEAFVVENDDTNHVRIGPTTYNGRPGDQINWTAQGHPFTGWKCELTAQPPVFDADLGLEVTVIENIQRPDPSGQVSNYSGMPIGRVNRQFGEHRIDSTPTVLYFINKSSYFVNISVQRIAAASIINKYGSYERRPNVPVNALREMSMGPAVPLLAPR